MRRSVSPRRFGGDRETLTFHADIGALPQKAGPRNHGARISSNVGILLGKRFAEPVEDRNLFRTLRMLKRPHEFLDRLRKRQGRLVGSRLRLNDRRLSSLPRPERRIIHQARCAGAAKTPAKGPRERLCVLLTGSSKSQFEVRDGDEEKRTPA